MVNLLLLACTGEAPTPPVEAAPEPMGDLALLARLSLDLRGTRPTEAEIERVEADPAALDPLVDELLADEGFGERLVSLYADIYRTRADSYVVGIDGDGAFIDGVQRGIFRNSVGEEPLRLLARIAMDDRPWTDFVTVDWTMTNDHLINAWPVEAVEEGTGWRMGRYTDARPAAGVLATNGMWWRYTTTIQNANRGRAEAVARYLLCDNRFDQPVEFRPALDTLDARQLVERINTDDACISCHVMLDPLGSYLFGFYRNHPESYSEAAWYYPAREQEWQALTGTPPGFYGQPGETLYDLGQQIAADPRFVECAVEHGFQFMYGREPGFEDTEALVVHRNAFIEGGLTLRALYRSLTRGEAYRSTDATWTRSVTLKRKSPDQLASSVAALTGFRWTWDGLNLFTNDEYGLRVLAGGADGLIVTQPASDHATTALLVQERLAEAAADAAVGREAELPADQRTLFREVELDTAPDDTALETQITALILRAHTRRAPAGDEDVSGLVSLWRDTYAAGGDTRAAWKLVLGAVLRHPDFVLY
jgi:hypothetical protein